MPITKVRWRWTAELNFVENADSFLRLAGSEVVQRSPRLLLRNKNCTYAFTENTSNTIPTSPTLDVVCYLGLWVIYIAQGW